VSHAAPTNLLIFLIQEVIQQRGRTGRLDALDFSCENFF
jgi:hypothetical protein